MNSLFYSFFTSFNSNEDEIQSVSIKANHPGPINNYCLLSHVNYYHDEVRIELNSVVKPNAKNFIVVNEEMWKILDTNFKSIFPIARKTILNNQLKPILELNLYQVN